jgi:hypothetical protein
VQATTSRDEPTPALAVPKAPDTVNSTTRTDNRDVSGCRGETSGRSVQAEYTSLTEKTLVFLWNKPKTRGFDQKNGGRRVEREEME